MTALYLHDWPALESARPHHPVTPPRNKQDSLVARIALSLVGVAAVAGVVGLGTSALAVQQAPTGHVAVPSPARPATIPGHHGLPVHQLPILPDGDR